MQITEFSLKDVRCFAGEHSLRIRPLTFLVGENSTGKSTVLGCMQAMVDLQRHLSQPYSMAPDFNQSPYQMGSFREIVRKSRPSNTCFELGATHGKWQYRITLSERKGGTEPIVVKQEWGFPKGKVVQKIADEPSLELAKEPQRFNVTKQPSVDGPIFTMQTAQTGEKWFTGISRLLWLINLHKERQELSKTEKELFDFLTEYDDMPGYWDLLRVDQMTSIAPLRSAPRRTYDPVGEFPDPSGADIPMRLMNLARNHKQAWASLQKQLIAFGKASGLFTDFQVRQLGKSGSNPFQIQVKTHGPMVNLIDTGYGVSQILPILANVLDPSGQTLLVQQPEVHLHPRGQAELTTLLVKRLATRPHMVQHRLRGCVIETHSDYMLDRARIEIRHGKIARDDVSLIYLEKTPNKGVQPHNITFDGEGNMENAPPSYGEFFLREGDRLLGFNADGEQ